MAAATPTPRRRNLLYRGIAELGLAGLMTADGRAIFKAPVDGAVLVDPRGGEIKIGQDLRVGFSANDGAHLKLYVSESLALLLDDPAAICTLEEQGPGS